MAAEVEQGTAFEWVIVPDIRPWDDQAGEPANPIVAGIPIRFALVPLGGEEPAEADYLPGQWTGNGASFDGRFSVGSEATVPLPATGVFAIYCAIDGVQSKPRRQVGQLVVK